MQRKKNRKKKSYPITQIIIVSFHENLGKNHQIQKFVATLIIKLQPPAPHFSIWHFWKASSKESSPSASLSHPSPHRPALGEKKHISFTEGTCFYVLMPLLVLLLNQGLLGVHSTEYWVLTPLSGPLQICKSILQGWFSVLLHHVIPQKAPALCCLSLSLSKQSLITSLENKLQKMLTPK